MKEKFRLRGGYFDHGSQKKEIEKLEEEMNKKNFWDDPMHAKEISQNFELLRKEHSEWEKISLEVKELRDMADLASAEKDASLEDDIRKKLEEIKKNFDNLEFFVLLSGKYDKNNAIFAIHAGAGGVEAQDWAEMLFRMLLRYCNKKNFQAKIIDESRGQEAGIKSVVVEVIGHYAYGFLQSEAGVHRLVRISPFDAEKMRHTSFALIEVLPEILHESEHEIKPEDLKIDVFRSGGKGGQSVNTTDSAVRITHIPTGIVVKCQNERSQAQNKETAMKHLCSKLVLLEEDRRKNEMSEIRGEFQSAEWGNQIRSYVLQPYKMVKDHRTNYEDQEPDKVLDGEIHGFVESYLKWNSQQNPKFQEPNSK